MSQLVAAGLLMCRFREQELHYFLVHPGGPFFAKKDDGVWTIPKGLPDGNEDLLQTAVREFEEETGIRPAGPYHALGNIRQKRGKIVHAWCFMGDWDPSQGIRSNTFRLKWPPKSKKFQEFPEQDRGAWMNLQQARRAMIQEQQPFLLKAAEHYTSKGRS